MNEVLKPFRPWCDTSTVHPKTQALKTNCSSARRYVGTGAAVSARCHRWSSPPSPAVTKAFEFSVI